MDLRNVAIIAHVDHGKTTLVDGLLKQSNTFRENEAAFSQTLILDSNDQEKERGITILAKNTAVNYKGTKINIIDTPGHADFGGEVERTLNMADGAILIIDAQEGPMPQTKFVLKKALEIGLLIIVVINKIDKRDAMVDEVIEKTHDLFLDMATDEAHLDFPVYYAIGRTGKAWAEMPADYNEEADLTPIFKAIIDHVPAPRAETNKHFQMLIAALDSDTYQGKYAIGRISRGSISPGTTIILLKKDGTAEQATVDRVYVSKGLKRIEVPKAEAGDIVALTGIGNAGIGETLACVNYPEALPVIEIEEPTLKISISANTSPFAGQDGKFVTSNQIKHRILKELETNVSLKMELGHSGEFILSGRGELHLSVFLETLRREGYEFQVGKPQVITKIVNGKEHEPVEELIVDVPAEYGSAVISEVGKKKGSLLSQEDNSDSTIRLVFEITTRGLLGLRNQLLTQTKGTVVMNSMFLRYQMMGSTIQKLRNGALISSDNGKAVAYGLGNAQERGVLFIEPQTSVYTGMIVGVHARANDLQVNVAKVKKLTNMRAAGADDAIMLTPPTILTLEQSLDFLEDDELMEVTPNNLRLRKKALNAKERARGKK